MQRYGQLIQVADLRQNLQRPDWCIVDCRFDLLAPRKGREEYEAAHVPGAVYADLDIDLSGPVRPDSGRHPLPDPQTFVQTLRSFGVSNATQVVAYDAGNGALAARLWWMLRWLGHADVAVLDGGFAAWCASGAPTGHGVESVGTGSFAGVAADELTAETSELADRLAHGSPLPLVDARDRARFDGVSEPYDSRAGHIPGALNLPLSQNLASNGHWRPAAELQQQWQQLFRGTVPPDWAVMCGSGVTACHLALAAEIAGVAPPRLYTGSWSEWIRDPARPIEP